MASQRVCRGIDGWIRHFPVNGKTIRRSSLLSIVLAQTPLLFVLFFLAVCVAKEAGFSFWIYTAGIPFLAWASASAVFPGIEGVFWKIATAFSGILAASGNIMLFLPGLVLLAVMEFRSYYPYQLKKKNKGFRQKSPVFFRWSVFWRAVGLRIFLAWLPAVIFIAAGFFFVRNNSPSPDTERRFFSACICLGMAAGLAIGARILALRRPPWPWERSFPVSSSKKIIYDGFLLGICGFPSLLTGTLINFKSVWPVAVVFPFFCLFAAWAVRTGVSRKTGALGPVMHAGLPVSLLMALLPMASMLFILGIPVVLKAAGRAEKQQKVSRWMERHYLAAGDSMSWKK